MVFCRLIFIWKFSETSLNNNQTKVDFQRFINERANKWMKLLLHTFIARRSSGSGRAFAAFRAFIAYRSSVAFISFKTCSGNEIELSGKQFALTLNAFSEHIIRSYHEFIQQNFIQGFHSKRLKTRDQ